MTVQITSTLLILYSQDDNITNYGFIIYTQSQDDNITSGALTRDMHLQLTRYQMTDPR